jgi:hypothetical protein
VVLLVDKVLEVPMVLEVLSVVIQDPLDLQHGLTQVLRVLQALLMAIQGQPVYPLQELLDRQDRQDPV